MADIKRPNYFTYQFLVEKDFDDEQAYHMQMRRRHNRLSHAWGIADGLEVTRTGSNQVRISAGMAIDKEGREIALEEAQSYSLTASGSDVDVYLSIVYQEVFDPQDRYTQGGVDDHTRTTERPKLQDSTTAPATDGSVIVLARIHLNASGAIESAGSINTAVRPLVSAKLAPKSVNTLHIADASITADKLAPNAVDDLRIADGSVNTAELASGAVTTVKVADNAITLAKLAPDSVDASKIINGAVGSAELATAAVVNAKLADGSVTTTKLLDANVTTAKLADGSVTTAKLADANVTTAKLLDASITTAKLADGSVTTAKLLNANVTTAKLADGAVTLAKLAVQPIVSVDGVNNPGGDVDLQQADAITISPNNTNKRITIGESHSARTDNPHITTPAQIGALASAGGLLSGNLQVNGNVGINAGPVHRFFILAGDEPDNQSYGIVTQVTTGTSATFTSAFAGYASSSGNAQVQGIDISAGGNGTGLKIGLLSNAYGADGPKYAGQFNASTSGATSSAMTQALYAYATSSGTGPVIGLTLNAQSNGAGQKTGLQCSVHGEDGAKFAGQFNASTGLTTSNASTQGLSVSASSAGTGTVQGLQVSAGSDGAGEKQGIACYVSGADGVKRAGQFIAQTTSETSTAYTQALYAQVTTNGTGSAVGLYSYANASGNGHANGVNVNASAAGTGGANGVSVSASAAGTGGATGLSVSATGNGTGPKYGINCSVSGTDGFKRACQITADTNSTTATVSTEALWAQATSSGTGPVTGVFGSASSTGNGIVYGGRLSASSSGTGVVYGLFASAGGAGSGTKYAGYFQGNVHVNGTLSKSGGTFLIDHPLDPYNRVLRHNFVESPEELCMYRGRATLDETGKVLVKMPEYFASLTKEEEATVTLTPIGKKPFLASYEWNKKCTAFTIHGEPARDVSYIVLATRDDPTVHLLRRPVEEDKSEADKGKLLVPAAYEQGDAKGIAAATAGPAAPRATLQPAAETQLRNMEKEIQEQQKLHRADQERLQREHRTQEERHKGMVEEREKHERARRQKEQAFQAQGRKPE
jgi:hypothetical protein